MELEQTQEPRGVTATAPIRAAAAQTIRVFLSYCPDERFQLPDTAAHEQAVNRLRKLNAESDAETESSAIKFAEALAVVFVKRLLKEIERFRFACAEIVRPRRSEPHPALLVLRAYAELCFGFTITWETGKRRQRMLESQSEREHRNAVVSRLAAIARASQSEPEQGVTGESQSSRRTARVAAAAQGGALELVLRDPTLREIARKCGLDTGPTVAPGARD